MATPPTPTAQFTPVIVGVGQLANKDDDRVVTPLELIADAVRRASDDSGAAVLDHVDGLFLSPPWNDGSPGAVEALAASLGLAPGERRTGTFSGSMPQELVAQACDAVASGSLGAVVVAGGVADASVRRAHHRGDDPVPRPSAFWTGEGRPPQAYLHTAETVAGVESAAMLFAIVESRLAHLAGRTPGEQRRWLGEVMAPFTRVAASHPDLAWFPEARTPDDLATVHGGNRLVNEPYPKMMNSFPDVDLAGAVIVTSSELADRLGVPSDRRVHPWAAARCYESHPPSGRAEIHRSAALEAAVGAALAHADVGVGGVDHVDLYSCFPAAVQLGATALGLHVFDPRGLTTTGGLPYFGGPGAAYGFHAIAMTVERCRATPGSTGLVLGVGGQAGKFAVGLYGTETASSPWCYDTCDEVEAALAEEQVPVDVTATGEAVVEAMTISHHRERGPVAAPVIARLPDGRRTGARVADPALPAALEGTSLIGATVRITIKDGHPVYEVV